MESNHPSMQIMRFTVPRLADRALLAKVMMAGVEPAIIILPRDATTPIDRTMIKQKSPRECRGFYG
jgi:hypothetical protein